MADWYFGSYNWHLANPTTADGLTPETAWWRGTNRVDDGHIDLTVIGEGDTLWILDDHDSNTQDGYLQFSDKPNLTVRGDYPGRPGKLRVFTGSSNDDLTILNLRVGVGSFSFIDMNNIYVEGVTGSELLIGFRLLNEGDGDNGTIRNCHFFNCGQGIGIGCDPGYTRDGWLIENNRIHDIPYTYTSGSDQEGIGLQRLTNSVVRNNLIYNAVYGINIWESGNGITHTLEVSNNIIHNITGGDVSWPSRGIMTSGGSTDPDSFYGLSVLNNRVYNVGREGIRIPMPTNSAGNVCSDNIVANVNAEIGTPNTEHLAQTTGWTLSNNRTYDSWPRPAIAARRRRR